DSAAFHGAHRQNHAGGASGASMSSVPQAAQKPVTLGERVRAARHELGMSQAQLAGEELTKGCISQFEAGLVRPSFCSLQVIAGRLGKGIEYFVGDQPVTATRRIPYHRVAPA